MKTSSENVTFPVEEIQLEGILGHSPGTENAPGVVICHPHPQMGGSMDNNVVHGLFDEFTRRGCTALAFNFRGTGASGGTHDGGEGEIRDVLAAMDYLKGLAPAGNRPLGLVGYSFGGWIALQAALRAGGEVLCAGAVAPPLAMLSFDFLSSHAGPLFFTWGDSDPYCPSAEAEKLISSPGTRREGTVITGTDHFFTGREQEAAGYLCDRFLPLLQDGSSSHTG
jgi:alpha/beta superfamily hydrolase